MLSCLTTSPLRRDSAITQAGNVRRPPPGNPYRQAQHRRIDARFPVYNVGPVSVSILDADGPPPPPADPSDHRKRCVRCSRGALQSSPGELSANAFRRCRTQNGTAVAGSDIYPAATRHRERMDLYADRLPLAFDIEAQRHEALAGTPISDRISSITSPAGGRGRTARRPRATM